MWRAHACVFKIPPETHTNDKQNDEAPGGSSLLADNANM